jgi:GntR family transcriptional regulator/MocR family aminotransferase
MQRQIYDGFKELILQKRYGPGMRIPSSRSLAEDLGVSRNTITGALDQLIAEGYIEARVGAGAYVARELPQDLLSAESSKRTSIRRPKVESRISARGKSVLHAPNTFGSDGGGHLPFRPSLPAYDQFPLELWARLQGRVWRRATAAIMGYGNAAGYTPLRRAVAAYLSEYRGVRCTWEQVIITSGSQQGLDLAALVLIDAGDAVVVEDPGYLSARAALRAAGAKLFYTRVDAEGAVLPKEKIPARLFYVTPSHQYPLGITMSLKRRLELLEWAAQHGAWVLEDDYDAEFRYSGRPIPSLQGLDPNGRVIYVGTFSKVLLPGLRLGYLVVPDELVDAFVAARMSAGRHCQMADQAVLSQFIEDGHFYRHIRRMRVLYAERQSAFVKLCEAHLADRLSVDPSPAGMHLPGYLAKGLSSETVAKKGAERGLTLVSLKRFAERHPVRDGFLLGYTSFSQRRLADGVKVLAGVLKVL